MNLIIGAVAAGEFIAGLTVLACPLIVVRLLFGAELSGAGIVMSRLAGIALIALGAGSWPKGDQGRPLCGLLTYNLLATAYLLFLGLGGQWRGTLLWPAAAAHAVLSLLLGRAWLDSRKRKQK
jgi:hypothetical protein